MIMHADRLFTSETCSHWTSQTAVSGASRQIHTCETGRAQRIQSRIRRRAIAIILMNTNKTGKEEHTKNVIHYVHSTIKWAASILATGLTETYRNSVYERLCLTFLILFPAFTPRRAASVNLQTFVAVYESKTSTFVPGIDDTQQGRVLMYEQYGKWIRAKISRFQG